MRSNIAMYNANVQLECIMTNVFFDKTCRNKLKHNENLSSVNLQRYFLVEKGIVYYAKSPADVSHHQPTRITTAGCRHAAHCLYHHIKTRRISYLGNSLRVTENEI